MAIAAIEDAILDVIRDRLGPRLRWVGSLPRSWTADLLRKAVQSAPGVYVAFLGGPASRTAEGRLDARFGVYAVTGHASGQAARRRGDTVEVGAYEVIETAVRHLHGHDAGEGRLRLERIDNLFTEQLFDMGGCVMAAVFACDVGFGEPTDPDELADFVTCHADYDMAAGGDEPPASDTVTLPQ